MQTAVLDSYAILPLVASLLVQGVAGYFLFKIWKTKPEKFPDPIFFKLSTIFVGVLGLGCILALIIPSLLVFSSGVLVASVILVVFLVLYLSFAPTAVETKTEEKMTTIAGPAEDPLVEIGQQFISHVSGSLTQEVNLTRLLDFINETMIKHTASDGGVVFLADDFEDIITSKAFAGKFPPPYKLPQDIPHKPVRVETNFRYAQFKLGETIFGEVAATGKPVLIERGEEDARIFANGPEDFLKPGSYIVVPLMINDRVVGVSGIARQPENIPFSAEDFRRAKTLASYAGASINNVYSVQEILERADLEREAGIASQIQKTLHPKRLPELPEVGFGAFFNATKGVCGDYYDIILARRDRIAILIADVAGKGIHSSMVMIMLRSILHLVTNTTKTAGTILDWVNKGITGKIDMDHYATLSFVSYCPSDHTLEYASAGHQPMLLWHDDTKTLETVRQKTDPIGVERSSVYSDLKLTVQNGDIIILFTDGLIETLNPEGRQYGIENLSKIISANSAMTAKELATEVKHNIQAFTGSASIHDDQTLVIMKIKA
jgi:sigma-B regulation protein RsbU (phosphoserine phosphatase)